MEALELLGSRYIKPEQVAVGPVETLRAQNAATWRVVFIHRVSTTQESSEQANLLKLLTTALVRSAEAKRLVLDFGEEHGFWNVVTESEPQCESLREWLQAEVDGAEKSEAILSAEQAAAMGEFARLFARGAKHTPRKVVPAKQPKAATPAGQPPPQQKQAEQKAPEPAPGAIEAEAAPTPPLTPAPPPPPEPPLPVAHQPAPREIAPAPPEPAIPAEPEKQRGSQAALASPGTLNAEPPRSALPAFEEEKPIVFPDEIPVIVISAPPPVTKATPPTQSTTEAKPPQEDPTFPIRSPLPPRSFAPRPPPLVSTPVDPHPLIPEIVTELPKPVADAPKVVPIDGRPLEPKPDAPKTARTETAAREDAPLFANSMPKPAKLSKMAQFFILLGVVALLLVLVIVYLSLKT